jgi:hypothetical protein
LPIQCAVTQAARENISDQPLATDRPAFFDPVDSPDGFTAERGAAATTFGLLRA